MLLGGNRKVSCRQGNRPGYIPPEQVGWARLLVHFQPNKSYHRAAAHDQLDDLESVIADCNVAVKLNNKYVKALDRRAKTVRKQAMQASAHILDSIFLPLNVSVLLLLQVENYVIQVEKLKQCLEDITSVCILEGFQKQVFVVQERLYI